MSVRDDTFPYETSHTFGTRQEAEAFMLGFELASKSESIRCDVSEDEDFSVDIDVLDEDGMDAYQMTFTPERLEWLKGE